MLLHLLSLHPGAALSLLVLGTLLVYLECNRPGLAIPGGLGALLVLLNGYALSQQSLRAAALLGIGAALLLLSLEILRPVGGLAALLAGLLLTVSLHFLVSGAPGIPWWLAIVLAPAWTALSLGLGTVAVQARRNKRVGQPAPWRSRAE